MVRMLGTVVLLILDEGLVIPFCGLSTWIGRQCGQVLAMD